jgi:uncharacterized protein (TIGR00661 family)
MAIPKNINNKYLAKKVLISPLDWGLGHATRCIPIIKTLCEEGFEVILATEGNCAFLLAKEFPQLKMIYLKGYRVKYSNGRRSFFSKMLSQVPKIISAVVNEHRQLKQIIENLSVDIVIADNRYGMYNKNVFTVFITHQLFIKTGNHFTERVAQRINYFFISKFNLCIVPDAAGAENLAGELSHPQKLPATRVMYTGVLSRFKKIDAEKNIDLLMILSGPEPQRTIFENILLAQTKDLKVSMVMVRGLPENASSINTENNSLTIFDHLSAAELSNYISSAKIIIARSGYSTVMDIAAMQQKAIFVPTPGQTEQEYLAAYLSEKAYCTFAQQEGFNLEAEIERAENTTPVPYPESNNVTLDNFIERLR